MTFAPDHLDALLDTVRAGGSLSSDDAAAVTLAAALAHGPDTADVVADHLQTRGFSDEAAREVALQGALYLGVPRSLGLLAHVTNRDRSASPSSARLTSPRDLTRRRKNGEALFTKIYGEHTDRVLADLDRYHPELRDWILVNAYGHILARPELPPRVRELMAVAFLVVSGDFRPLSSHMRGAIHCGATPAEVDVVLELTTLFADETALSRARTIRRRVVDTTE